MRPVRRVDEPTLDPVRATTIDGITARVLLVADQPVPDEGDARRAQERTDDLGADVAGHLRPWETATPGEGQRDGRVQLRPGHRPPSLDGDRDGESPEESR